MLIEENIPRCGANIENVCKSIPKPESPEIYILIR